MSLDKQSNIGAFDWTQRMGTYGSRTLSACPECGKGLSQDDAFGHDCEVFG